MARGREQHQQDTVDRACGGEKIGMGTEYSVLPIIFTAAIDFKSISSRGHAGCPHWLTSNRQRSPFIMSSRSSLRTISIHYPTSLSDHRCHRLSIRRGYRQWGRPSPSLAAEMGSSGVKILRHERRRDPFDLSLPISVS